MKKTNSIIYWVSTILFSLFILMGAIMYFVQYDMVSEVFTSLGVPTEVIYPLGVAKILGVIAICFIKNPLLKKLAYLCFALDLIMGVFAHLNAGDGHFMRPVIPLVLLIVSYVFYRRVNSQSTK